MKLIVKNIYTQVVFENSSELVFQDLILDALSVRARGYFWSPKYKRGLWDGYVHLYNKKTKRFPTGLLGTVKKCLNRNFVDYVIEDQQKVSYRPSREEVISQVNENLLRGVTLRDYQMEAIIESCSVGRGVIYAATNAGKTEIAAGIIKVLNLPSLYLVNSRSLVVQTAQRFEERLGRPVKIVAAGLEHDGNSSIVVGTVQTFLSKMKKAVEPAYLNLLKNSEILFLDECHMLSSDEWYKVAMHCQAGYRYGLSGTPFSEDEVRNMKLRACTDGVLYRVDNKYLINKGYSSCPKVYFYTINQEKRFDGPKTYEESYQTFIVENRIRNNKIVEIVKECMEREERVVILVRMIEHGRILNDLLSWEGIRSDFIYGIDSVDRRDKAIKSFLRRKRSCVIASAILDQGIDIRNMQNLIIASGGVSRNKTLQRIGRALRKGDNPYVNIYDFIDKNNKYLTRHSKMRMGYCLEEGFEVIVK